MHKMTKEICQWNGKGEGGEKDCSGRLAAYGPHNKIFLCGGKIENLKSQLYKVWLGFP